MSRGDVLRRDLVSVYRSRTATAVTAVLGAVTAGAAGLLALSLTHLEGAALVGTVVAAAAVVALVFLGDPRTVAGAVAVYACYALAVATLFPRRYATPPGADVVVVGIGTVLSFALPLVAMLAAYAALVGEQESGSVRFLFGLPNARDDAYLGKYLSRAAVVVVPLVGGLLVGAVVAVQTFERGTGLGLLGLTVVTVPYALLFVGFGITASGVADSENQAVALAVVVFVLFRAAWPAVQWLGLQGMRDPYPRPEWYFAIGRLNPMNAHAKLTTLFIDAAVEHPLVTDPRTYEGATVASTSFVTSHWFAAVVLLAWTVLAPLVGLLYYRRRDLL